VLHIAALIVAAASAAFGLLAHVREVSMTCCSTFISGFAAVIALFAFIFDLIVFFVAKARISSVGSAKIGSGIWLTFAAWVLLFLSGCFYSFGRSCISNRPSNKGYDNNNRRTSEDYASNQTRLDAVKAEADRKARQKQNQAELGLPAFPELEREPLTASIRGDQVDIGRSQAAGYVERAPGTRAMDDYYENSYPPQPSAPSVYSSSASPDPYASNALPPAPVPQLPTRQYALPTERPYGYTSPSPVQNPVQISNQPSYFNYPQYNPYDGNPYGEIRPSTYEPFQNQSLLDPPSIPSAPTPTLTPPLQHSIHPSNQFPPNPYLVPSSTSGRQNYQPANSGYPLDYGAQTQRPVDLPPLYQS